MRDRPRPDLNFRNLVVLAVKREAFLRHSFTDDQRALDEAIAGLLHIDTEAVVFDRGSAAPETKDGAAAGKHVEQCDIFGDLDRVVPWQHDHRGAELNL